MYKLVVAAATLLFLTGCAAATGTVANFFGKKSIVEVSPGIFIGNSCDASKPEYMKSYGIDVVFNVAEEINDKKFPGFTWVKIGLEEKNNSETERKLGAAVNALRIFRARGCRILIHCRLGENRSPYVVAKYLSEENGTSWKEEFDNIKILRPEVFRKHWMF